MCAPERPEGGRSGWDEGRQMRTFIKCDVCPRCKDTYPGKVDADGYHFHICGMGGNKVYTIPHRIKRYNGKGYINFGISSCGIYESVEDALKDMTEPEIKRWRRTNERRNLTEMD
jgi:hypothetical protein